ncbi:MAG: DUF3581 domain-containing protein [Alteromonadaceae bacterium]|nr:DUF3581 domain-containing protein [Alteromonadaceae bacterium]
MFIEQYYNELPAGQINFTRQQASDFAKKVADDFNPLHNIAAKRFCVPGDLLFAVILAKAGLHKQMSFTFSGMVTDAVTLNFPQQIEENDSVNDANGKEYLQIKVSGEHSNNSTLIDSLTKAYVEFSGHTFPHILVKLMAEHKVMINPARPMIMYQSMSIDMFTLVAENISLRLAKTSLSIEGKRGNAWLEFDLLSNNEVIGHGKKHMLLSGLRDYCQDTITQVVEQYNHSKAEFSSAQV